MFALVLSFVLFLLLILTAREYHRETRRRSSLEAEAQVRLAEIQKRTAEVTVQRMEADRWKEESRWKDLVLAGGARELRERVQSLSAVAETLIELGPRSESKDFDLLERTLRGFHDSASLLLEYSRFSDPLFTLDFRPVDLESLARELAAEFSAQPDPLYLDVDIPCLKPVSADPLKIRQILRSLVEAAVGATGQRRLKLLGGYEGADEGLAAIRIRLEDLPDQEILASWLEAWNRSIGPGDTSEPRDLGLPIAQKLLSLHGTGVEIHPVVPGGAEILFYLRVSSEIVPSTEVVSGAGEEALPLLPALEEQRLSRTSSEPVILMVDDDPVNLHLMTRNLSAGGYRSVPVDSGEKALELLKDNLRPDLIVLDLLMPGMGGLETLRILRKSYAADILPVLLLTAKNQASDVVDGFEAGANDFITKPVGKRELIARIRTHLQLTGMAQAYGRFVPPQLLHLLNKGSVLDLELGDFNQRTMTILFCDLRNFTSLSETMSSRENFKFINRFFEVLSPAVVRNRGFVDKYLGDGFMALFPGEPENGLSAAMEMQKALRELNRARVARGRIPLEMGIGVHTGEVILGVVGSQGRMEGTVISDAVNMASRLESQTKAFGCHVLVSRDALFSVRDISRYSYRFLGNEFLKGKQMSVAVYELFENDGTDLNTWKLASKDRFEESLVLFSRGQLEDARELLQRLHDDFPADRVIASFLSRCRRV